MPTSMQSCKHAGVTARQPSLPVRRSRTCTITRAVEQIVREAETTTSTDSKAEIYIGFPKNDTGSREGRKGRVVIDDPAKYPGKDDIGFLAGATGGWAGGEAALVKLRESIKEEMKASKVEAAKPSSSKKVSGSKQPGAQPIYVGYGKDELELRKSGEKGRVIYDDATKYPGKEDVGPLAGATGGFAGGERGVKAFVATGEVKLRKAGEPGGQPISPLTTAFLVLVAGAGSAAVVSQVSSGQEVALPTLDGLTLNMAIGALALLTVGAVGAGARNAASSLQSQVEQVQETASKVVITGAFLVAVFLAARAVLEV